MLASVVSYPFRRARKRTYVRDMFTAIAPTYDRLNRIISLGLDQRWRRDAVTLTVGADAGGNNLDLCAGTLGFGAMLAGRRGFRGRIVGADFVQRMLSLGGTSRPGSRRWSPMRWSSRFRIGPSTERWSDGARGTWSTWMMDSGSRARAQPGARLVILEMTLPPHPGLRRMYLFYFNRVLPWIGRLISKHTVPTPGFQSRPGRSRSGGAGASPGVRGILGRELPAAPGRGDGATSERGCNRWRSLTSGVPQAIEGGRAGPRLASGARAPGGGESRIAA
jgi:demethylmenaquinone methyltransferase/2-methoxy-6-polyprenyl-1,4-benzoquinol methylase